jgi:hypothetical protein
LPIVAVVAIYRLDGQDVSSLTCTASVAGARDIDANTATGLVGDVLIRCSGGAPTPAGQPAPLADFFVSTVPRISITSRLLKEPGFNTLTDALIFADDPSPDKQTLCVPQGVSDTCPGSRLGSGDGRRTYDPDFNPAGPRRGNAWLGLLAGTNELRFAGIPVDPPGAGIDHVPSRKQQELELAVRTRFARSLQKQFDFSFQRTANVQSSTRFSIQNPLTLFQCDPANAAIATNPDVVDHFKTITATFQENYGRAS